MNDAPTKATTETTTAMLMIQLLGVVFSPMSDRDLNGLLTRARRTDESSETGFRIIGTRVVGASVAPTSSLISSHRGDL